MTRIFAILGLAVMLAGCAIDDSGPIRSVWRNEAEKTHISPVVYVTDREPVRTASGATDYATRWAGTPSCGVATTWVPTALAAGETPTYGFVSQIAPQTCEKGGRKLGNAIAMIEDQVARQKCRSIFLFVHGFHTNFAGAIPRASQVANDAGAGCVVAFSWSAEVDVDRYVADLEHSDYAQPLFAEFLRELSESGLHVTILAHSLGSRLTLMTLSALAQDRTPPRAGFIDELILAAPDIGVDPANNDFEKLMTRAAPFAARTTIYASSNDTVLEISRREHGGIKRLGFASDISFKPTDARHVVDIIDASMAPADRLDHSYYAMSPETIRDMGAVLAGVPLEKRLKGENAWPPTLSCGDGCRPNFQVKTNGSPRFVTRLILTVLPVVPLVR